MRTFRNLASIGGWILPRIAVAIFCGTMMWLSCTNEARADFDAAVRALQANDYVTALPMLRQAADAGNDYAQVLLAQILLNGRAGVTDPVEAANLYQKLAVQDPGKSKYVAIAQLNLAALYWSGRGVEKDTTRALKLYRQSADNGSIDAQKTLVGVYYRGDGGPKDLVQAFKWALVCFANGKTDLKPLIVALSREASAAQRAEALQQAKGQFPNLKFEEAVAIADALYPRVEVQKGLPSKFQNLPEAFRTLHEQPLDNSPTIIPKLQASIKTLSPPLIFELSRRILSQDKQEALTLFWLARLRMVYDASRCTDSTAAQAVPSLDAIAVDVIRYGSEHPDQSRSGRLAALERETTFPLDTSPEWICVQGMNSISAAMGNRGFENWLKPVAQWQSIHQSVRDQMEKAAVKP
jgi:hypothetical protein